MSSDDKKFSTVIRDVVGVLISGILASLFFSTDHRIFGIWFSFIGIVAASHIPFESLVIKNSKHREPIWFCYWMVNLCFFIGVLAWSYNLSNPSIINSVESKLNVAPESIAQATNQTAATDQMTLESLPSYARSDWMPPELPPDGIFNISFGGNIYILQTSGSNVVFTSGQTVLNGEKMPPFDPFIISNRIYLKTKLYAGSGEKTILMNNTLDSQIPPNWDRNYSSNAFEVVDNNRLPVFQVIYAGSNIYVNGVFYTTNNLFVAFDGKVAFYSAHYLSSGKTVNIPNRRAIFKYPSWQYPGDFIN